MALRRRSKSPELSVIRLVKTSGGVVSKLPQEGAKMTEVRMKVAPDTVAYADGENHKLVVEFAIPGAPADTIDLKILEDSVHLTAPARTSTMSRRWL